MENIILRDPNSRAKRLRSGTVGTSGRFAYPVAISLNACIKVISHSDIEVSAEDVCIGEGQFGKCYLRTLGHFKVCVKIFKTSDNSALTHEANILSRFFNKNLPYLFGISIGDFPSIITSYHGFHDHSLTIHRALFKKIDDCVVKINWKDMLIQVINGLEYLHIRHKVIHNDLKSDNIVLTSTNLQHSSVGAVIIDFGKACEASKGKSYTLSHSQKEYYKLHHPQIAPDLRDGKSKQSASSDIYSFGIGL